MFFLEAKRVIVVIFSALLLAISLNFFLINANVYASGFTGAAQLASSAFADFLGIHITTGTILLLMNIPVFILGWFKVGKGFTVYSILSVICATFFLEVLPILSLSDDIILNSVECSVICDSYVELELRWDVST